MSEEIILSYGDATISISLYLEPRKTLRLTVSPNKTVTARAPLDRNRQEVLTYLNKRAGWIIRQQDYFDRFHPIQPPPRYVSGETHYYLGRQYRLRIKEGSKAQVRLIGRFFMMDLPDPTDSVKAEKTLNKWFTEHARILLLRRVKMYIHRFIRMGAREPEIRFRKMQKRWGSCSPNGVIMLNTQLVKAPIHCIDYVVIHELCHLLYPHHDKAFYKLLSLVLPDWEKIKRRLETVTF